MSLTGGFDLTVQIADAALSAASERLHAQGVLCHRSVRVSGSDTYDLVLGPPVLGTRVPQADGKARLRGATRAIVRARPTDRAQSTGRAAVADIAFRAVLVPPGTTRPLAAGDVLRVDLSETGAADVVVHTTTPGFDSDVRAAVLEMVAQEPPGLVVIGSLASIGARRCVPCTVAGPVTGATLALAIDMGSGQGSTNAVEHVLRRDWAVALGRDYLVATLEDAFRKRLGGVPPPRGPASVVLQSERVCVFDTPFGCLATAERRMLLTRLELDLAPGRLTLDGTLLQQTVGMSWLDIAADWHADVVLAVTQTGAFRADVLNVSVQLAGVLAAFENAITGGRLQQAVRDGVVSTLETSFSGGPLEWLDGVLGALGSTGGPSSIKPADIETRADGVVLHGIVVNQPLTAPPVAAPSVLPDPSDPRRLLLSAAGSWAPGGHVETVKWQPGDGSVLTSTGDDCRLATEHVYPAVGTYTVCLEVTDRAGRVSHSCRPAEVGILRMRLVSKARETASAWEVCGAPGVEISLDVAVTATRAVLPGVTVSVRGSGWSDSATTDRAGVAHLRVDVDQARASPATGGSPPAFNVAGIDVVASAPGWAGATRRVWIVDCAAVAELRQAALRARGRWVERLAGYAELAKVRAALDRGPVLPPGGLSPAPPQILEELGPPRDPRYDDAAAIGASIAMLEQLSSRLVLTPGDTFVHQLLGGGKALAGTAAAKRLDALWAEVDAAARKFERDYGEEALREGRSGRR